VPSKIDRFGNISSVGCINSGKKMLLEINTANSHTLTVIEDRADLKPGDEIMFRRWYGISHHAIFIPKMGNSSRNEGTQPTESSDSSWCNISCKKSFWDSGFEMPTISHTFDERDARVKESTEWFGGIDAYEVEYDSCYPLNWTDGIARRAAEYVDVCKKEAEKRKVNLKDVLESNYDPLMDNCEHFARRCKTGQSESRQVKSCVYNCGKHVGIFALRVAILAVYGGSPML